MNTLSLFPQNFLAPYLSDFSLSAIPDIRKITERIKGLNDEVQSGKLESLKEEEIKSRFISTFFGDVLGFNYGNSNKWLLREEKKSVIDATKADAALGYFFVDKSKDDVRAVVELKNAKTNLDDAQSRPDKQSPVAQAFAYSSKTGGNCKWVIVSNMIETRFYASGDQSKCQAFFLKDLINEDKLKELLYLFHKDRFIKEDGISGTEKLTEYLKTQKQTESESVHIIDKMYHFLLGFKGLGFVDPNFIAASSPFNILNEHVWHYGERILFTINTEIYELLNAITIHADSISFSAEYEKELINNNVTDPKGKMESVFRFLNQCMIHKISGVKDYKQIEERRKKAIGFSYRTMFDFKEGVDGVTKNIWISRSEKCDCLLCNYRSLNFKSLINKLKAADGDPKNNTLEYAYGNYLTATDNFKKAYLIYKEIEKDLKGKDNNAPAYFVCKLNLKLLHNLILDYELADSKEIMGNIRSVDLDKVIYDEIEFSVTKQVKKYLIDVKEDALIYKLQDQIEETVFQIEKLKRLYDGGGIQQFGPNLPSNLSEKYYMLFAYTHRNYIIYDIFKRYTTLTEKVFRGLVISTKIPDFGLSEFNDFLLTEAILHVAPSVMQEILKDVEQIPVSAETSELLITKVSNYSNSYFDSALFGFMVNSDLKAQLHNFKFQDRFTNIFANLFAILSRINITKEQFAKCSPSLLTFLKLEDELAWYDLRELAEFIKRKGDVVDSKFLIDLLSHVVEKTSYGRNKYENLIKQIPLVLEKHYPSVKVTNSTLVQKAILQFKSPHSNSNSYDDLINLTKVCDENCRGILFKGFEDSLDSDFNKYFYELILRCTSYDHFKKDYFQKYCDKINERVNRNFCKYGDLELTDLAFINMITLVYNKDLFSVSMLDSIVTYNDFESWLLRPSKFHYTLFNPLWLIEVNRPEILKKFQNNSLIKAAIEKELSQKFNSQLAEIKYKYFS
ncbi:MAG: hypothetical protein JNK50_01135 [Bacteroidia bacterium]|nr:hypothetical protein [Bacteroidia bacterium]